MKRAVRREEIEEAIKKALDSKERNFVESVDLTINLQDVDMRKPENRINVDIVLPNKFDGRKIATFAGGEIAVKAKKAGVHVISPEEIEKMDKKDARKLAKDYDFFIAEASLMPKIGKTLGVILGPRGKMPEPLAPDADVEQTISRLERTIRIRARTLTIHSKIGRRGMGVSEIAENAETVIKRIESKLRNGWQNIASIYVKTTMGKPVKI